MEVDNFGAFSPSFCTLQYLAPVGRVVFDCDALQASQMHTRWSCLGGFVHGRTNIYWVPCTRLPREGNMHNTNREYCSAIQRANDRQAGGWRHAQARQPATEFSHIRSQPRRSIDVRVCHCLGVCVK